MTIAPAEHARALIDSETLDVTEGEFTTPDHLRLVYHRWQEPDIEPRRIVLTLHGFADHSARAPWLIENLCKHGAIVYGLDQRGSGLSQGQRGHVPHFSQFVDDFGRFIAVVEGAGEPAIERIMFAHSTGAIAGLSYVYQHPETFSRLILSAPALILAFAAPAWKTAVGRVLSGVLPRLSLDAGFPSTTLSRNPIFVEWTNADPLVTRAMSTRYYNEVYLKAAPAVLARIPELKVPFFYAQGSADPLVSTRVAEEFRSRATVANEIHLYDGSLHEWFNDLDRDRAFADLDAWLEHTI